MNLQAESSLTQTHLLSFDDSKCLKLYLYLQTFMIIGLCICVVSAPKIIQVQNISFPCCNLFFALFTFPITDTISEVLGIKYANKAVIMGFIAQFTFVFLLQIALYLPPATFWQHQQSFTELFGSTPRILIASMIAFLVSQFWDVYIYGLLKKVCNGKAIWLRNNLSTMSSQLINSILFIGIAFGHHEYIMTLIIGSVIFKWCIAIIDTPIVYFLVKVSHNYLGNRSIAYTHHM